MSMSTVSANYIMENIDVTKRLQLSMAYPAMRPIEQAAVLKLDDLRISSAWIQMNNITYLFMECDEIPEKNLAEKVKRQKLDPELREHERSNLKDDELLPGDLWVPASNKHLSKSQQWEIIGELRRMFMEALEKHLTRQIDFNPIGIFNLTIIENRDFSQELKETFQEIGGSSTLGKVYSLTDFFGGLGEDKDRENDEIDEKFPKAYDLMKETVEKLEAVPNDESGAEPEPEAKKKLREQMANVLKKLLYPEEKRATFNQYETQTRFGTGLHDYNSTCHRLPENLSRRQAYKIFTNAIFGKRHRLHVAKVAFYGDGIYGFPEGFKFSVDIFHYEGDRMKQFSNTYGKIISSVNFMKLKTIEDPEFMKHSVVRNSANLFLGKFVIDDLLSSFGSMENDQIYVTEGQKLEEVIENWSKKRKVGSHLYIDKGNAKDLTPKKLKEMKFVSGNFGRKRYHYRQLSDGKKMVLKEDVEKFTPIWEFRNYVIKYYHFEMF